MADETTIRVHEVASGVHLVTLARPGAANALNSRMGRDLLAAWTRLSADESVRVVVLTGDGSVFCAGADLKERNGMTDEAWGAQHRLFEEMIGAQLACPHPVIAAVNGPAIGGGCELVLACDFAWASVNARFGLPEAGLGIVPGLGGTQNLSRAVGERQALEMLMSGQPIGAQDALRMGLVNRLCEPGALVDEVVLFARTVAAKAPLSIRALKRVVRAGAALPIAQAMEVELAAYNGLFPTADRREGVAAFNEKRPPRFQGR